MKSSIIPQASLLGTLVQAGIVISYLPIHLEQLLLLHTTSITKSLKGT
jgi:hypothetical protein